MSDDKDAFFDVDEAMREVEDKEDAYFWARFAASASRAVETVADGAVTVEDATEWADHLLAALRKRYPRRTRPKTRPEEP